MIIYFILLLNIIYQKKYVSAKVSKTRMTGPKRTKTPRFIAISLVVSVDLIALALSLIPIIQAKGIRTKENTVKTD
jgi:hypothetical protein